jgi:hypothetical protein
MQATPTCISSCTGLLRVHYDVHRTHRLDAVATSAAVSFVRMSSAAEHEALATVLMTPVGPGLLAVAFLVDTHFMAAAERDRAWHPALFGNAVALSLLAGPLGILCLPLHIARTRRGLRRVVLPPLALIAYFIVLFGAAFLVDGIATTLE